MGDGKRFTGGGMLSDNLAEFRAIITKYGITTAAQYDALAMARPSRRVLCRQYGCTWRGLLKMAMGGDMPTVEPQQPQATGQEYKCLHQQIDRYRKQAERARDMGQVIYDACVANLAGLRIVPAKIPQRVRTADELEFHLLRSDAQVGQETDAAWTQGVAKYNAEIYEDRINTLIDKITVFKRQDEASLGLNKLVIDHLGDQVEGEGIFKGQAFELDLCGVDQLFRSVEVEGRFLVTMAGLFESVEVFCVPGNHGRPGGKGENHPRTNFDYIFYRVLALALRDQANIRFYISESPSMIVQNGRFRFLLNHGDNAKGWGGIPYYGLDRMSKRVDQLFGMIIDYNLCGHHHTPCNIADKIIMNGCIPGGSDLSVNRLAAATRPSQKCFYFHPMNGINRESNLYLADPVNLGADGNGIYTSYTGGRISEIEERVV